MVESRPNRAEQGAGSSVKHFLQGHLLSMSEQETTARISNDLRASDLGNHTAASQPRRALGRCFHCGSHRLQLSRHRTVHVEPINVGEQDRYLGIGGIRDQTSKNIVVSELDL